MLAAVASLPFTQAMTLDVGFPLKLYEMLLVIAIAVLLVRPRRVAAGRHLKQAVACSVGLVIASVAGLPLALTDPWRPAAPELYRYGSAFDALLQLGYLVFAIVTMFLVAELVRRRTRDVLTWWVRGGLVAAAYALTVNVQSFVGLDPLLLPAASTQVAQVGSLTVHRAGTFLEGIFFGLYLLVSVLIALSLRRRAAAAFLTAALLLSLSSLSIVGVALVWLVVIVRDLSTGRTALAAGLTVAPLLAVALLLPRDYYYGVLLEKLTSPTSQSSIERRALATAALDMAFDHPVAGVGLAQYGLWFPTYRPAVVPPDFLPPGRRYIANNVYAQVAAEQGVLGLLSLFGLLLVVLRATFRTRSVLLSVGLLAVLTCLNAFPSLTVAFVWAFFGVLLGCSADLGAQARRGVPAGASPVQPVLAVL